MGKLEDTYKLILQKLDKLRKRQKVLSAGNGALVFIMVLLAAAVLALLAESVLYMGTGARYFVLTIVILAGAGALAWFVGRPLFSLLFRNQTPDDIDLAMRVGLVFSQIRDRLADALQVFRKHADNREGYSLDLADRSLAEVYEETRELNFDGVASAQPLKKTARLLLVTFVAAVILFALFPSALMNASHRLLNPTRTFARDLGRNIEVSPGDLEVVKGQSANITVNITGKPASEVALLVRNEAAKAYDRYALNSATGQLFTYRMENIIQNREYYVVADGLESDRFKIDIVELPFVRTMQIKLNYPRYSRLGSQFLEENVGDISALKGTQVSLSAQTNKTVSKAAIVFDDSTRVPLTISGQALNGTFSLARDGSYHIDLTDSDTLKNDSPIEYRLSLLDDQSPIVQITFPGQDVDLNKDMLLPLTIEAQDDFGISKLRLGYQILQQGIVEGEQKFIELPLEGASPDNVLVSHSWDMSKIGMYPEDIVTYFAEAFDNDVVSGPKSTRSLVYRVRFPSIQEMYEEVADQHDETFEELQEILEESKSLKETVDQVVQEMKRNPELNWEQQQEVQDAAEAQGKMREELEQLQQKLDEMVNRMEQNDLVTPETLEKYRELQSLMQEMLTEEMKETLEKLQKSMDEMDPKQLQDAMEKFAATQEDFLRSMERTLNLLKKLQVEQKLDEAVRKAQDLMRRQEELNKEASGAQNQTEQNKYAEEQRGLRKDSEGLEKELEDLKKRMSEFPDMNRPQEDVQNAQNQLSEEQLQKMMEQAAQQMQSGQMQSAQQSGEQISQDMQEMVQSLQNAQQQLTQQQKQKIMQALKRSSHDLLSLSQRQETLQQETKGSDRNTPGLGEKADQQENLVSGLNRVTQQLYELSQNTFFVTSDIGKALGQAMGGMQQSLEDLEARNPGKSQQGQSQAMAGLNEAAANIRNSMQSLSGASSGIGFEEMMQRMTGMSGQQQGINEMTQNLGQGQQGQGGQQGGLSMEQQASMQRLAAEQDAVRKSLEQLMREAGKRSEVLGDFERISDDMGKVVDDLQNQNLNANTVERQKNILSRMLDAQRSMHDRDYSKKRQAESGKTYQALSPAELPDLQNSKKDRLKNELLKAMKEGYTKDYKELIQKYFEALAEEEGASN